MTGPILEDIEKRKQQLEELYQLEFQAALYCRKGKYAETEELCSQALKIANRVLSENRTEYAVNLKIIAGLYYEMGQYTAAEPLYRQAIGITRQTLGEDHPEYANGVSNLAKLYRTKGEYKVAEELYREALEITRKALGVDHPEYGRNLNALAELFYSIGNYAAAEPLFHQAIEISRKIFSKNDPLFAVQLSNLGVLYRAMGNYAAAEPQYREALEIRRSALGENHPDYATSLNNLAGLYRAMGKYPEAMPLYRQGLEIIRQSLGESSLEYSRNLNDMALLYQETGNYETAERYYRQAIEIKSKHSGENTSSFATSLSNLAHFYRETEKYAAAEHLYLQALEIWRSTLGKEHPNYATTLNNLALLYHYMDKYAGAEPLYREALEIRRKSFGENHPEFATSLNNLAVLYRDMGKYADAEPLYREALEIRRKTLGKNHPNYATSLNNLAVLHATAGRIDEAFKLMQKAADVENRMIGQIFSIGSESQRLTYWAKFQINLNCFLSLVADHLSNSLNAVQASIELVLRRKAIGAEALSAQRDSILSGRYPALHSNLQELIKLRRQITQKTLDGPGKEGSKAHLMLLTEWTSQKESLEEELARQIPEMNLEQKLRSADLYAVADALPSGTALIEFVHVHEYDYKAVPARGDAIWKSARYLAFVLPAGKPDKVRMIDLGEAESIDRMLSEYCSSISGGDRNLRPLEVHPRISPNDGYSLRRALFDPLVPALNGRTRLFLAPDGCLTRLPFESLPIGGGRCIIDDYQISYLTVGRDVLRFGTASSGRAGKPLVVADPEFDLCNPDLPALTEETKRRWRHSRSLDPRSLHFRTLPGTNSEGKQIAARLGVQPWLKEAALEGRLKACRSPRILHIATHGFFLEDQKLDPKQALLGLGRLSHALENPLLRSGLALAGANSWLHEKPLPAEAEDGILTAEDVSGLNLLGTELVVLSACETGLGEVQVGEGVFGLRRAFVLAGAKTLVMSLWEVPDQQTQELMKDYYKRILAREGRAEALRQAQLAMKKKYPDPLYWGAFICQGDPGPLIGRVA